MKDFAKRVGELRNAFKSLLLDGRHYRGAGGVQGGSAISESTIGLTGSPTSTTIQSVEEVNTTPTSYSTTSPSFDGASSSSPTIGGIYSGANGDTTLTFTATSGGIIGLTGAQFEVRDSGDNLIDTISTGFDGAGTAYTLSNGLEVSFASGTVVVGDSFQVDVFSSVGSAVRPDNAFNGTGDSSPGFEDGFSVTAGSFEVNGTAISVFATDTLNDVLSRVTASAAGVTASFDVANERVLLTQNTPGPSADIVLSNDTSGLLAATKLDTATSVLGEESGTNDVIANVAELSGIQTGSFSVNGVQFLLDTSTESLADVISRINASDAGAIASYNSSTGKFSIRSTGSSSLTLNDGTSNFFSELDLEVGTFAGSATSSKTRFRNKSALHQGLRDFESAYRSLFQDKFSGYGASAIESIRNQLEGTVKEVFDDVLGVSGPGTLQSGLGVKFKSFIGDRRMVDVDASKLGKAMRRDSDELAEFLFADSKKGGKDGLVTAIGKQLSGVMNTLETLLGQDAIGLNLDVSA